MIRIKRLYLFILQTFLPLFLMTFFICLFIVLMQFLWRYIDDLVGKGLDILVIAELFFYAALSMVPLALPLSVLLASLMAFGNLGEHFELTAMKSSGVSLTKIMSPLIVFLAMVSVGAFFFQNDVLPKSQVKMWSLLFSMRQKSPELDIPEGTFYDQIQGYNLYVNRKDRNTGTMHDLMIYDVSNGYGYARVILADSGKLSFTNDKKHLFLQLHSGELFEDLKDSRSSGFERGGMLYRRETFNTKEILIPFDATFTRMDDETMRDQYIGKNLKELAHTIDSVRVRIDSMGNEFAYGLKGEQLCGLPQRRYVYKDGKQEEVGIKTVQMPHSLNMDSIFNASTQLQKINYLSSAKSKATRIKQNMEFRAYTMEDVNMVVRRHQIEMQKKFTLSFACLIFFFIGAPLGAIIRKGGLGTPIVVSVLLFIAYYIVDNMGYKLARDGHWVVWEGIWLSSEVLLPLGIFLTYKAANDSAVFNPDAYRNFFRKLIGTHQVRHLVMKEVVMDDVVISVAKDKISALSSEVGMFLERYKKRQSYLDYWLYGYDKKSLRELSAELEGVVEYLSNSRDQLVVNKVMDYPYIRQLLMYHTTNYPKVGLAIAVVFPIGLIGYLIGTKLQKDLKKDLKTICSVNESLIEILNKGHDNELNVNNY